MQRLAGTCMQGSLGRRRRRVPPQRSGRHLSLHLQPDAWVLGQPPLDRLVSEPRDSAACGHCGHPAGGWRERVEGVWVAGRGRMAGKCGWGPSEPCSGGAVATGGAEEWGLSQSVQSQARASTSLPELHPTRSSRALLHWFAWAPTGRQQAGVGGGGQTARKGRPVGQRSGSMGNRQQHGWKVVRAPTLFFRWRGRRHDHGRAHLFGVAKRSLCARGAAGAKVRGGSEYRKRGAQRRAGSLCKEFQSDGGKRSTTIFARC